MVMSLTKPRREIMKREFYKIRLLDNVGEYNEWHSSNNGTSDWGTPAKVKSVITRGIRGGYKGRFKTEFANYQVVKITETVKVKEEVIEL
jgi:hypothetical protein